MREIRRQHFAVLATSDAAGRPASAGITYGVSNSGTTMYLMTRRHLQKARNIVANPRVSLVVPTPRRLLWFVPPATMQLTGHARVIDWTDQEGTRIFSEFWLGRRILDSYRSLHVRGESRIAFLRIELEPVIHTYMVGTSVWRVRTNMEAGASTVIRS
ncbi:pyridoxamine 5'-phosphate oxidase family protein [Mycobacterium sp. EPa45]|uniref:pyridoxamine 5'-phosphate oxidase family protein n=1 Tax=Mycobacterium sp. EPa45 TaxID=1545728 RepID=UPI001F168E3E|nr:pyridoxamine 5'-phosphate oxidase family protein [Mycobacterium sp. EPa45]